MTHDLTTGKPLRAILSFSVPVLLGSLFQQFYNMTDSAIVGQFVGVEALAGVGSTGSINFLIIGFVTGLCTGFSIPIAQSFGAGDTAALRKYFTNAIWLTGVFSVLLTVLTMVLLDPILQLMQTPEDIYPHAKTYIGTIFAGITGIFLYNLLAAVMRSLGDSRTPVFFLIFASVLNVILDLIFVLVFHMGVFGTSFATVIAQTVSGLLCIFFMIRHFPVLRAEKQDWRPESAKIRRLCSSGIPMGLQFSVTAIGSICVQSAINLLGSTYVAAVTAANRIGAVATSGLESLGLGMATYTGQNLGAQKPERIRRGVLMGILAGAVYWVAAFLILLLFSRTFALLFVSAEETAIIDSIFQFLMINSSMYLPLVTLLVLRNAIQGMGYSALAIFAGAFEMVARFLVAFGSAQTLDFGGICFANPAAWAAANLFLVPAYFYVIRKVTRKINAAREEQEPARSV